MNVFIGILVVLAVLKLHWIMKPSCRKCGSKNVFYQSSGEAGIYSMDEMFHCHDCGNDKYENYEN